MPGAWVSSRSETRESKFNRSECCFIQPTLSSSAGAATFLCLTARLPAPVQCKEAREMSAAAPAIRNQVEAALGLRAAGRLQEALDTLTAPGEYLSDFY